MPWRWAVHVAIAANGWLMSVSDTEIASMQNCRYRIESLMRAFDGGAVKSAISSQDVLTWRYFRQNQEAKNPSVAHSSLMPFVASIAIGRC